MNAAPLADLRPLMAPAPVSWWPPAPGWWILAFLCIIALAALAIWAYRRRLRYQRTRYQREAIALLEQAATLPAIAEILRRTAISALGRDKAATVDWQSLCNTLDESSLQLLRESLYRADAGISTEALSRLREQVQQWIVTLPPVEH